MASALRALQSGVVKLEEGAESCGVPRVSLGGKHISPSGGGSTKSWFPAFSTGPLSLDQ